MSDMPCLICLLLLLFRSLNGVKDMVGYRMALNLSYTLLNQDNSSQSCGFDDDVETSSILVRMRVQY